MRRNSLNPLKVSSARHEREKANMYASQKDSVMEGLSVTLLLGGTILPPKKNQALFTQVVLLTLKAKGSMTKRLGCCYLELTAGHL